jgi:hypothetical protein
VPAWDRRSWLYAVEESVEDLKELPSWRTGRTLVEKARLGQAELLQEVLWPDMRTCAITIHMQVPCTA